MEEACTPTKRSPSPPVALPSTEPPGKRRCPLLFKSPPMNEDGQTTLHLLCQDPRTTVETVQEYLSKYPAASQAVDVYGRTAIFYALKRSCAPVIVDLVFQAHTDGLTKRDFLGESGLFLLYHPTKNVQILASCLQKQPSLALYKSNSFAASSLLDTVCIPWMTLDQSLSLDDAAWTKLVLTVQAAHRALKGCCTITNQELHMALELQLPAAVVYHFTRLYPEQARRPMVRCQELLPLQYVVSNPDYIGSKECDALVRQLVHAYPDAAAATLQPDASYPLHVGLSNNLGWLKGLEEIAFAYPDASQLADPVSGLLPFMQAAAVKDCDLNTVYCLLRERPLI